MHSSKMTHSLAGGLLAGVLLFSYLPDAKALPGVMEVQIVDDTGWTNSPWVALIGKPYTPPAPNTNQYGPIVSGIVLVNQGDVNGSIPSSNNVITPQLVSSLTSSSLEPTVVSSFTGMTRTVKTFNVSLISSGNLYFFYNRDGGPTPPFQWSNNSNPSAITYNNRYDFCEFSYITNADSAVDLTTIDQLAIPMQIEYFQRMSNGVPDPNGDLVPVTKVTWYASLNTFIKAISQLDGGVTSFEDVLLRVNPAPPSPTNQPFTGWDPATNSYNDFIRLLGPTMTTSNNNTGDPAPYPSFENYLQDLVAKNYTFRVAGSSPGIFDYTGQVLTNSTGYHIAMTTNPGVSGLNAILPVDVLLPNGVDNVSNRSYNYNTYLYGASLSTNSYLVGGVYPTDNNDVYGAAVRDVLAGINMGYMDGDASTNSARWYGDLPVEWPFGLARTQNDGRYNPWSAYVYNYSDAYGFAFSDTRPPSPAFDVNSSQGPTNFPVIRVTLLPDDNTLRLDSPRPTASATIMNANTNAAQIDFSWDAVTNSVGAATNYTLTIVSPEGLPVINTSGTSYTMTNLIKGIPYFYTLTAAGHNGAGTAVVTPSQTFQVTTPGTPTPHFPGTSNPRLQFGFGWQPTPYIEQNYPDAVAVINETNFFYRVWITNPTGTNVVTNRGWVVDGDTNKPIMFAYGVGTTNGSTNNPADFIINQYPVQFLGSTNAGADVLYSGVLEVPVWGESDNFYVGETKLSAVLNEPTVAPPPGPPYGAFNNAATIPTINANFPPIPTRNYTTVATMGGDSYNQWISGFTGVAQANAAPADNPDGDIANNLLEYFFGTNPEIADDVEAVDISHEGSKLVITYKTNKNVDNVSEVVEWSDDLQTWSSNDVTYTSKDEGQYVERTASVPLMDSDQRLFLRINVSDPNAGP